MKKETFGLAAELAVVRALKSELKSGKVLRGPQGEAGKPGPHGVPGKDGKDGRNGKDGVNGSHGPSGPKGEKGEAMPKPRSLKVTVLSRDSRGDVKTLLVVPMGIE